LIASSVKGNVIFPYAYIFAKRALLLPKLHYHNNCQGTKRVLLVLKYRTKRTKENTESNFGFL